MLSRRTLIVLSVAVIVGCTALWLRGPESTSLEHEMATLDQCVTRGVGTEDTLSLPCLRPKVERLLHDFKAADIMDAFDASTTPENVARSCHEIGHVIGRSVYTRTGSIEDAFAACTESCASACIHGITSAAIEAELGETLDSNLPHFSAKKLETVAIQYCEKSSALCHTVGHLLRLQTDSLDDALMRCTAMGLWRHECAAGVFMEDAGGIESRITRGTSTPTHTASYTEPCSSVPADYQSACFRFIYLYQNQRFADAGITSKSEQIALSKGACDTLSGNTRTRCDYGLGGAATRITFHSAGGTVGFCESLPTPQDQAACTKGLNNRELEIDH